MFGRSKTPQPEAPAQPTLKVGGKGRPTPTRKEAQARGRQSLVGAPVVRPGASKEERKAARTAQRQAMSLERNRTREALLTGDERHLPERDKGPARKFARDYVDARRGVGEYFMLFAVVVLGLSVIPSRVVNVASIVMLYAVVLAVAVDSFFLRRRVTRLTTAKYGDKAAGAGTYAMMRSLQLRRTRMPRAQVKRGDFPT